DRRVERLRRLSVGIARPYRPERFGKLLPFAIAAARECVNLPSLESCDLRNDVRRGAETINANSFGVTRFDQRTVANQSRAQQRSCFGIGIRIRYRKTKSLVSDGILRISAIESVAGKTGLLAKI